MAAFVEVWDDTEAIGDAGCDLRLGDAAFHCVGVESDAWDGYAGAWVDEFRIYLDGRGVERSSFGGVGDHIEEVEWDLVAADVQFVFFGNTQLAKRILDGDGALIGRVEDDTE